MAVTAPQSTQSSNRAAFWCTFSHEGKICPNPVSSLVKYVLCELPSYVAKRSLLVYILVDGWLHRVQAVQKMR
jgi:hypothetical protein